MAQVPGQVNSIKGKTICIDPGHGGTADTDTYRVGPSGEREEWVNLRVALYLQKLLQKEGAVVIMTRTEDVFVPLEKRSAVALEGKADLFVSIHHNATADNRVNFPIIYFHGSATENQSSVRFGKLLADKLVQHLFSGKGPYSLVSDHTIFPKSGASVLRGTYGIPALLGEATFFTHPEEEKRLKKKKYNKKEANAYLEAIQLFFNRNEKVLIKEKSAPMSIPPFAVFQEADRMRPEAKDWHANFLEGKRLFESGERKNLERAYNLLILSIRSFPDSYVARQGHQLRVQILKLWEKTEEAEMERERIAAYYPE